MWFSLEFFGYTDFSPKQNIAIHIIVLTTLLIGCVPFLAGWLVSAILNIQELSALINSDAKQHLTYLAAAIVIKLCCAGVTGLIMWILWKVLLLPLRAYRDGDIYWTEGLVFNI